MKKFFLKLFLTIALLNFTYLALAQSTKTITLKDGSVIKGTVVQFQNNVYTVKTPGLGQVDIPDSQIVSLTSLGEAPANNQPTSSPSGNPPLMAQVQQMQNSLLSDPKILDEIKKLIENKEIMTLLADQNFVNDVLSYDPKRIEANQKTKELIQNPQIQNIMKQINQKMSTGK